MRLSGHNVIYKHAVRRVTRPRTGHVASLCGFHSTSNINSKSLADFRTIYERRDVNPNAKEIAILGGGITGLAAAWNLSTRTDAKITIYEKSDRLGGWVDSEVLDVNGGRILFEWGPRTLRPALGYGPGMATVDMLAELNIADEILPISKSSPAATNRYIYYPDHLVVMPGPVKSFWDIFRRLGALWTEPIFQGILSHVRSEPFVKIRDPKIQDESVGDFLTRRFGSDVTDNLASAFFHGIYAGDIYQLSARTLLPLFWYLETRHTDKELGILWQLLIETSSFFKKATFVPGRSIGAKDLRADIMSSPLNDAAMQIAILLQRSSVYTFKGGLGEITSSIEKALAENPNVTIQKSSPVNGVTFDKSTKQITVNGNNTDLKYDYVVSSLGPNTMLNFLGATKQHDSRKGSPPADVQQACHHSSSSASVMVVNLYYSNPSLIPASVRGFGYLIPRSVPFDSNPERALGVIFSSETSTPQGSSKESEKAQQRLIRRMESPGGNDAVAKKRATREMFIHERETGEGQDTAPGTKLTVMMGGHWWKGWQPEDLPSEDEAIEMAKALLKRHLGIDEAPEVAKARLNRDCIPQYPVGYREDMATIHRSLISEYQGRFKVAGPWWQGAVGFNDCIRKAREVAWAIQHGKDEMTGLEEYDRDEVWFLQNRDTGKLRLDRWYDE
ncbi:oxygen-dependent protoporphyrinogen oxidase [Elasticomyces elasticus]|uniref:Protoporphyrinogen oxidase n=1 Tax=Exophiala sideris TaxID=1016849 RepID=A0ABR0JQZ6_9EURO|nr:oxygen-dependent protoporphyrinogen oxidase [Elasticomyces elasticus]KAK5034740.1 oxygen-dependent protoporphyrinogen oxidase [Exophiala sideris]KAK5039939.1 oxygen-dependent protoporphyrinogen oxidase [Exophiala sideris]KAK5068318.1 oxygen-dependent protoporphyrinogen oxidase [Exophiala sideris]KAK5187619.1 oxygen-dependent protoporphyrinogen oxidase [Eurotiomycetes sp. CCFEE 6388]